MLNILALATLAAPVCTTGDELHPPLCPAYLPAIAEFHIERQGFALWDSGGDEPTCAAFHVSKADIRSFFVRARQADPHDVHMTLLELACAAQGSVTLADGSKACSQVNRFGLGWLERPGRARMTLYCRQCRSRPGINDYRSAAGRPSCLLCVACGGVT